MARIINQIVTVCFLCNFQPALVPPLQKMSDEVEGYWLELDNTDDELESRLKL